MTPVRLSAILLTAIVLAFAAAGCGGDDGDGGDNGGSRSAEQAPDVWAASVCGALGDWVKSLQAGSRELGTALGDTKDLKTVKTRFVSFLEDAEQKSGEMVEKVKEAGPPDVEQGEAIQDDLVAALTKVQQSFANAADRANELSTSSLPAFSNGVGKLSQSVQDNLAATGDDFNSLSDRYQSAELDNATDGEPACQQFSSGG
jgi:hypothetical protein